MIVAISVLDTSLDLDFCLNPPSLRLSWAIFPCVLCNVSKEDKSHGKSEREAGRRVWEVFPLGCPITCKLTAPFGYSKMLLPGLLTPTQLIARKGTRMELNNCFLLFKEITDEVIT